ncbi:hypothetical protein [Taibaiella helva]|uniref:hypothetical protein n=1 Tax=Taibaiella helva TaxID=2301235 RepID=UPI000E58B9DE|nr:hypothetical protein [Taibaiella helva]
MNTVMLKERLHEYIDHADEKHLEAIYVLLGQEMDAETQRKALIQSERAKYLRGEGKSYSPDEVKAMALNKNQRHAI